MFFASFTNFLYQPWAIYVVLLVLFALVALAVLAAVWWLKPKGFKRFALEEFKAIQLRLAATDQLKFIQETNLLLRRIAIRSFGQPKAVGLTGLDWLEFLDWSRGKVNKKADKGFVAGSGRFLNWEENPDLPSQEEMQALIKLVTQWIKRHT